MKQFLYILIFLAIPFFSSAKDQLPETKLIFSPFVDTIVTGFDSEIILQTEYDIKNISITGTNCKIMLKDAEKGIYVITAPVTSAGKKSKITVSVKNANGNFKEIYSKEVKIVAMTTEMRKRYVNNLNHKK